VGALHDEAGRIVAGRAGEEKKKGGKECENIEDEKMRTPDGICKPPQTPSSPLKPRGGHHVLSKLKNPRAASPGGEDAAPSNTG
jgi:hypothetical protein